MTNELRQHITVDPKVMVGKPVIKGTRVPVELIVRMMSQGISADAILKEYPALQTSDIHAALGYAAEVQAHEDIFPLSVSG